MPPKIFGDDPPRQGAPFDRSSIWIVRGPSGTVRHTVPCDTMVHPELRDLLRVLFAGTTPTARGPTVARGASVILEIEWREHGKRIAVSRLFDDGTLAREKDGALTLDRELDLDALDEVEAAIDRADLRNPARTFCPPDTP